MSFQVLAFGPVERIAGASQFDELDLGYQESDLEISRLFETRKW